ncbi:hypothetical protein ACFQ68_37140 [Amycolatopsis japonica]|uniref:hypothetical protein n=1 Tax=Amycolatopsis japonica TaxID=208439 RepID=UPI00366F7E50
MPRLASTPPCTRHHCLHTTPLLEDLETALGKPVLTATAVTLWDALHALGAPPVRRGLGKLFSR